MARPKQTIVYRTLPAGVLLTFVSNVTMTRPQPYYVLEATGAIPPVASIVGTYDSRRKARRGLVQAQALMGQRAWVVWFNRKTETWYYEFTTFPAV